MDGVDTSPEGRREQAAARVLRETLERVTRIEARTSQGLDRALLLYAKLQERSVNDVPAIDGYGGNEPN
jgi:hypothetical protein